MASRCLSGALAAILLPALAGGALAQDESAQLQRGSDLLTTNCSRCHAIGRTGNSTHPQAPPFRTLNQRYPVDQLAEALAEGLSSGHPDMPEFRFEISDVNAVLVYLRSIQSPSSH
jgi:cytochrome c